MCDFWIPLVSKSSESWHKQKTRTLVHNTPAASSRHAPAPPLTWRPPRETHLATQMIEMPEHDWIIALSNIIITLITIIKIKDTAWAEIFYYKPKLQFFTLLNCIFRSDVMGASDNKYRCPERVLISLTGETDCVSRTVYKARITTPDELTNLRKEAASSLFFPLACHVHDRVISFHHLPGAAHGLPNCQRQSACGWCITLGTSHPGRRELVAVDMASSSRHLWWKVWIKPTICYTWPECII